MAKASSKKASAASAAAAKLYRPLIIGIDVMYCLMRWQRNGFDISLLEGVFLFCILGLQYFSYVGIIENAVNRSSSDKSLVGGSSLDLLGATVVIQFGSFFFSKRFYWLLFAIPPWGAWSVYRTFTGRKEPAGGQGGAAASASQLGTGNATMKAESDRREKRAERRRQKWS